MNSCPSSPRVRLLLIEDNEDDALLIRKLLREDREHQFVVATAGSLAEGVGHLERNAVDVVLLDLTLPDSSGMETFRALHWRWNRLPVLVLTGFDSDQRAIEAVTEGAQDYLVKDRLNADGLSRAIRYAIERNRAVRKLEDSAERLRAHNETMHAELELAGQIQQALLPRGDLMEPSPGKRWRVTHRYLPWNGLAGDFFQVFPLEGDRVGVLICDVMGHGVRSALVAALIRGLVDEGDERLECPARLMTWLNGQLVSNLWNRGIEVFVTACYMVADPRSGKVVCANAGHPYPLELQGRKNDVECLKNGSANPALGLFEAFDFRQSTFDFDPQDSLLLYTDGIGEVSDGQDAQFAEHMPERLRERMGDRPDRMLDGLIADARQFSGSKVFDDDVCLVCLQFS